MPRLRLRPLRIGDEAAVLAAHRQLAEADAFPFALGYVPGMDWGSYLKRVRRERAGVGLLTQCVPSTFLLAEADGELVGRASIRHALNDSLLCVGGHVGFAVLPAHRRRGHASEILRQSVIVVRALGVDRVLVTCDEGNAGSAGAIERCGGVFESHYVPQVGAPVRRYWIG